MRIGRVTFNRTIRGIETSAFRFVHELLRAFNRTIRGIETLEPRPRDVVRMHLLIEPFVELKLV